MTQKKSAKTMFTASLLVFALCFFFTQKVTAAEQAMLRFPTASTTGALYPLGAGIANLWNKTVKGVRVAAQASNGGLHNINLLLRGEGDISFAISSNAFEALHGKGPFTGRPYENLRVLTGLYYNPNQLVARKDSGIHSLNDLQGKKVSVGPIGGSTEAESNKHLTEAGIDYPKGIEGQFVGFTEAIDLMRNKHIDAAWIMGGIPTAAVTEMYATADSKLIGIDKELIAKLKAKYPWYTEMTIPAHSYKGQEADIQTTAVKMLMLTDARLSEELVYELTKSFWDNLLIVKSLHNAVKDLQIDMAVSDLAGIPLHKGAEKYYRERGLLK